MSSDSSSPVAGALNDGAYNVVAELNEHAERYGVLFHTLEDAFEGAEPDELGPFLLGAGAALVDCGVNAPGGLAAGAALARICLADLADVSLVPSALGPTALDVVVSTDHPVAACLASQYAGWRVQVEKYFAMGSGPMRAAYGSEAVYDDIGLRETPDGVVGVLEASELPPAGVFDYIAGKCKLPRENVTLLVAPTSSLAGVVQIVARSVETALHKLHELKFDVSRIVSGVGSAPLPPPHPDFVQGMGRTNDAILYGGRVTLFVRGDDDTLAEIVKQIPSDASPDYGAPFAETFKKAGGDFYKIDPLLFSPAMVTFHNLDTGRTHRAGRFRSDVLERSFGFSS